MDEDPINNLGRSTIALAERVVDLADETLAEGVVRDAGRSGSSAAAEGPPVPARGNAELHKELRLAREIVRTKLLKLHRGIPSRSIAGRELRAAVDHCTTLVSRLRRSRSGSNS